jgi:hypothetical protein
MRAQLADSDQPNAQSAADRRRARNTGFLSAGANIVGSLFLGLFTLGLIAQAFIFSPGKGTKVSFPASPDCQAW